MSFSRIAKTVTWGMTVMPGMTTVRASIVDKNRGVACAAREGRAGKQGEDIQSRGRNINATIARRTNMPPAKPHAPAAPGTTTARRSSTTPMMNSARYPFA